MANPTSAKTKLASRPGALSGWSQLFIAGMVALALSFVVFLFVVADKLGNGDSPGSIVTLLAPTDAPETVTPGPTRATSTMDTAAPTAPAVTPQPTEGDNSPIVACGDILVPLDKLHRLAENCVPSDLVSLPASISADGPQSLKASAAAAISELFAAAARDGHQLFVNSAYRSYAHQVSTYNYWVQQNGREYADRTSARPGHSEHQLGTTADVGTSGHFLEAFSGTPAAQWLAANAWKFGFIVSYPDGKEAITGYAPEPWHIRFVGKDVASRVQASGLTLHEFLLR